MYKCDEYKSNSYHLAPKGSVTQLTGVLPCYAAKQTHITA